ncbi:MAG: HPF/RaiA family ribosome-associated protein [Bdellovibrionia bacterium]
MITNIYYRDITRTENLEAYLLEHTEGAIADFLKYDPSARLVVKVESARHRSSTRKPAFTCEVLLKPSKSRKTFKVSKTSENFYVGVNETILALKKILRRRSDIKARHGRRPVDDTWAA